MANHKSALKRVRQDEKRKTRNLSIKTRSKNIVKAVRTAVANNSEEQAKENLRKAASILQKGTSKGVIHKKRAARKISRLSRHVNRLKSTSTDLTAKG
ncbi:MAG: 30S ribosomal protein S20 [Deltaproteobacteria bacterium]|nr:30S ribosomal protein S20 [Deltaproteobacteria bacterium]